MPRTGFLSGVEDFCAAKNFYSRRRAILCRLQKFWLASARREPRQFLADDPAHQHFDFFAGHRPRRIAGAVAVRGLDAERLEQAVLVFLRRRAEKEEQRLQAQRLADFVDVLDLERDAALDQAPDVALTLAQDLFELALGDARLDDLVVEHFEKRLDLVAFFLHSGEDSMSSGPS